MKSVSNRQLTLLRKLKRKKYRYQEQLFLVEGVRAVRQILDNGIIEIKTLFFDESQNYWSEDEWKQQARDTETALLDSARFAEVSDTDNPQGVLALCRMPEEQTVRKLSAEEGIIVALDAIQDPGNVGTIIRTAAWFGAAGLLSGKGTVDLCHPKVVRSTAGATGTIPHINGALDMLLPAFESNGWKVLLLNKSEQSEPLSAIRHMEKVIIVVGNEGNGIDERLVTANRTEAEISAATNQPQVESLNAAIATSIALYSITAKKN